MRKPKSARLQQGFSLVEMMLASAVGLLVLAGVVQVFIGSSANFRYQDKLAQVQENGRFALDFITRDLRQTGLAGCLFRRKSTTSGNPMTTGLTSDPVTVAGIPILTGEDMGDADRIAVVITVGGEALVDTIDEAANRINLTGGVGLDKAEYTFLVSKCWRADLLRNTGLEPETPNAGSDTELDVATLPDQLTSYQLDYEAAVYPAQRIIYQLDDGTLERINDKGTPIADLSAKDLDIQPIDNVMPIAEGFTKLQFEFGERNSDGTIIYRSAQTITNMNNVVSARVTLETPLEVQGETKPREFTSTVFLRNYAPQP